jgi:hypothetical protein
MKGRGWVLYSYFHPIYEQRELSISEIIYL